MNLLELSSSQNPLLKEYKKLQSSRNFRRKTGKIAVEGPNLVKGAFDAGLVAETIFFTADYYYVNQKGWLSEVPAASKKIILTPSIFEKLSETKTPQEVAAVFPFNYRLNVEISGNIDELIIILDRIQDPGNMGTLIRTAVAAGVKLVCCTPGCTDPYSPKVLRATAGAVFQVHLHEVSAVENLVSDLKEKNFQVVAADRNGETPYWSLNYNKPLALIIGNETDGIAGNLIKMADLVASIPIKDSIESLNAAVAAGVLLFEINRQEYCRKT